MGAGTITVLFFAGAREAAGTSRLEVDLPPESASAGGPTVADVIELLGPDLGARLAPLMRTCAIWVNSEPVPAGARLSPGDEVAVLPPVSGG